MSSYAILTTTGRNKEAAAMANGTSLDIATIAWGDGDYAPSGGETELENEVGRKPIQGQGTVGGALNTAFFEILLTEAEGPFVIHEAGLFDDDGDLIAIVKYDPPVNKPKDTVSALLRINVVFSDLENLIIQIDATTAFIPATRRVNTGDGLTGGGSLGSDLNLGIDMTQLAALLLAGGFISNANLSTELSDYVTQAQMDAAFATLIGGAPELMNTLKEIADALADDDNAIAALTNSLATKLNAADYTAADILAKLLTVDGDGSDLDADTLDGKHASGFVLDGEGGVSLKAILTDERAKGVAGQTIPKYAWTTREINTEVMDADGLISLSANALSVTKDGYINVIIKLGLYTVFRVYNVTDGVVVTNGRASPAGYVGTEGISCLVEAGKTYRIECLCSNNVSTALNASHLVGISETYLTLEYYA